MSKLNVDKCVTIYEALKNCKLAKLPDADKYNVVKILSKTKAVADEFRAFEQEYRQKVEPEGWEDTVKNWENIKKGEGSLSEAVRVATTQAVGEYLNSVNNAMLKKLSEEVDVTFTKITEESFEKLLGTSCYVDAEGKEQGWDANLALILSELIVEETVEAVAAEEAEAVEENEANV